MDISDTAITERASASKLNIETFIHTSKAKKKLDINKSNHALRNKRNTQDDTYRTWVLLVFIMIHDFFIKYLFEMQRTNNETYMYFESPK